MGDTSKSVTSERATRNELKGDHVSRRGFLGTSLCGAAVAGSIVLPAWDPAAAQYGGGGGARSRKKEPKATARYQDRPNGNQRCGGCVHFRPPADCEIVESPISENGWCRHFKAKQARGGGQPGRSY